MLLANFVAISEHKIAKQDAEWIKEEEKKWKEVKALLLDDYQSLDEMSTTDLLEMKDKG